MPTTNINQRVQRIADLTAEDVETLLNLGVGTEEDLSFVQFQDLGNQIGLIKRRKLEAIGKFLAMRKDPITATTTIEFIQQKIASASETVIQPDSATSTETRGGPKVNTNPLPKFSGDPVDYESWELQAGATIRQTAYKIYLTRPAAEDSASEKERSSELFNMLISSVADGNALNIVEKVKDENQVECGFKAWNALKEWYTDSTQVNTIIKHYSNKLRNLFLDRDTTASSYINDFEIFVRKIEKYEGQWSEDRKIREFLYNVTDNDYDTEKRTSAHSYAALITAIRKRERDLGYKEDDDRRQRRFKANPGQETQKEKGKGKGNGDGNDDGEKVPHMPKYLYHSFSQVQRRNIAKWRALCNANKAMSKSAFNLDGKDEDESDNSTDPPPSKKRKGKKQGRKQRRITTTAPSGLPGDTVEVKLRDDTEEYFCLCLLFIMVAHTTFWHDSKFRLQPGHYPHARLQPIRRLDSIGMSKGRRSIQPYAVIDPGAVEELIGGDGWHIAFVSTQMETLSGALEGMGTLTLPRVDAITAVKNSKGKVILLGVGNATYDSRPTQYESLINSHHLRANGVDVQDIARRHGGLQRLEIKDGDEIHHVPLDFDGDIMKLDLRIPTEEEINTMGVIWITPAMDSSSPRSVRRSINVQSSYELQGIGNDDLPEAEVSTNAPVANTTPNKRVIDWNASLGYPTTKTLEKTLENTTQFCAGPVEMENREIPRQHRKKRLLPLHPRRLIGRVDSDTFFSTVKSIRGYKCVQLFVHLPSDYVFVRCMQRESHSHGAYQDFVREIGAPEIIATDNSQTQTGLKWETTSRQNITKQRKFAPHNQNQNKAERRIQDAKHKSVYVMEKENAPTSFWCYALIFTIDCLNHLAKESLGWATSSEKLNGDTPDLSAFRFSFWQCIEYYEPTAKYPEPTWRPGRFLGIAWDSGDAFTFLIWTEIDGSWSKGRELTRNIVRARRVLPLTTSKCDDDLDSFYFQKKVYTNKRRGKNRDRVYKLVSLEEGNAPSTTSSVPTELPSTSISSPTTATTVSGQEELASPVPVQEELEIGAENLPKSAGEHENARSNDGIDPTHTAESDPNENDVSPPISNNIEMVDEVNEQLSSQNEDPAFGGSGVVGIVSHEWRMGQLTLKVQWSSGDTTWEKFRDMKKDYPSKTAHYIMQNNVTRKRKGGDRDLQWAKKVCRDMDRAMRRLDRLYNFTLDDNGNIRHTRRTRKKKYKPQSRIKYGIKVPRTVKEALEIDTKNGNTYWQDAIKLEIDSLLDMNCFDFKEASYRPGPDYQRTTLHMVFDVKQDLRRKARLVAGGHLVDVVDTPTYSSTVKSISVQLLNVIAHKTQMLQLCGDIGNAYVNANTDEKVFARAGPEFGEREGCIVIIIKALYGLCSSSERWHSHFANTLRSFHFVPTRFDNDVWIRLNKLHQCYEYVCTHSDDFMITSHEPEKIMEQIESVYKVKASSKGPPNYYLGHDYKRDKSGRWCIGCKKYLDEIIKKVESLFGELPKNNTPMVTNDHPEEDDSRVLGDGEQRNYQMLIGILNWISCLGRVDIVFSVSSLSRFSACPREGHFNRVLRVFGYLKRNKNRRFIIDSRDPIYVGGEAAMSSDYTKTLQHHYPDAHEEIDSKLPTPLINEIEITAFVDSDHAHDIVTRRSITGLLVLFGRTPVFSLSKRQGAVETSTYGAEFCAMRTAVEELQSIRYMVRCLGVKVSLASMVCGDNMAVIHNCTVPESLLKKKHIAIAYHKSREAAAAGMVHPIKVNTKNNFADLLTKPIAGPAFWSLLGRLTRG